VTWTVKRGRDRETGTQLVILFILHM
jgi:hypothetical protein